MNGKRWIVPLIVVIVLVLAACGPQAAAIATSTSALSTAYEGALDVTSQLALGTMALEGTAQAVTAAQAVVLLPLWQALQSSAVPGTAEREAVVRQIEAALTEAQLAVIASMQLTQEDARARTGGSGPVADVVAPAEGKMPPSMPEGMSEGQIAQMREQFQDMSDEERAAQRAQFAAAGGAVGGGMSGLLREVVALLSERSGVGSEGSASAETKSATKPETNVESETDHETNVEAEPETKPETSVEAEAESVVTGSAVAAPSAGEDVVYVVQAGDTLAVIAGAYGLTVEAIAAANGIQDPNAIDAGQVLAIPDPARIPAAVDVAPVVSVPSGAVAEVERLPGLEQILDTDPGPPFTIEVSANYALQDPLVEKSRTYVITGIVRNDGDETYAVSDIQITFYDASGFRGTFTPAIRDGILVGGEWHWHGETALDFAALLLAPGEEWPYAVAITAQDMASFLIHPDAAPTGRESAPVALSDIRLIDGGTDYLRITGTATNVNAFAIQNVTVSGVLLDAAGQIVSVGSTYVLEQDIAPGASVGVDLRVQRTAYADYALYAQAERDWS